MGPRKSKLYADDDPALEIIRQIEGRWNRRFRYFGNVIIFAGILAFVLLVRSDPRGIDPYFVRRSTVIIAVWGIFLLLHTLKFLTDEARDRALEKVDSQRWSIADTLVRQPYRSRRSR